MAAEREISRLLVANRGEIAGRIFRTCRRLGIETVAVFSDADAQAKHVGEADLAVRIGTESAADSYLRGDAIVEAALAAEADAVHPGYGFLAENAGFAQAVIDAGLIWIGPQPSVISKMGSKVSARAIMEAAGVPVLGGETLTGVEGPALSDSGSVIGYPLIVKASAGGGGKGMRIVREAGDLESAVAASKRESASAFGDDTVFLERYVESSRHVEVQIFGDRHGNVVALPERDCTVQRRYQKVIEESPSPAVNPDLRARMAAAASAGAASIAYEGAGTFEFLLDPDAGEFFFLEVNTRLQVEHAVTEEVTGLDLVEMQIRVAEGRPLAVEPHQLEPAGHAVEARLYAEDPANDFLPSIGVVTGFEIPDSVRTDSGFRAGSVVSPHYDPMLGKVIAHGATRSEALQVLGTALRRSRIEGVVTNRDFLVRVLSHPVFTGGRFDTQFLEKHDMGALVAPLIGPGQLRRFALAAALAGQAERRADARTLASIPSGWRNNPSQPQRIEFEHLGERIEIGYRFGRDGGLNLAEADRDPIKPPFLHACSKVLVDMDFEGVRSRFQVARAGAGRISVSTPLGQVALVEISRHTRASEGAEEGSLESPMPGTVIRVMAEAGATVVAGQPLIVIEAMKMENEIVAPSDGIIGQLLVAEGDQVETGSPLAVLEDQGEAEDES